MDKKALLKTILCIGGFIGYLALASVACYLEAPVFIGVVLGPIVILAIWSAGKALYDCFKN